MNNHKKFCIISLGQISTNPRALKEMRALKEAGYGVVFTGAYCVDWALGYDAKIIEGEGFDAHILNWSKVSAPLVFYKTRIRYFLARKLYAKLGFHFLERYVLHRVYPEIERIALKQKADFYIAHNLAALPIAYAAAKKHGVKFGFDIEDYYSRDALPDEENSRILKLYEDIERKYLPACSYVSASSGHISLAYADKYGIERPLVLLNAFMPLESHVKMRDINCALSLYWFSQTIGENRGLEDVIRAIAKTKADAMLYLQGNISKDYKKKLSDLAVANNIRAQRIVFLDPVSPDDLIKTASAFDVGLALERQNPLNRDLCLTNKIFIYLASGLSIIATKTKGQSEIMGSIGIAGWSYQQEDIDSLAQRIDYLAADKDVLAASKEEALMIARERYNWATEKKKFLGIVEKVLL